MVRCTNGAYYTGYTGNLKERIKLHNAGRGAKYLRGKGPVEVVYVKKFRSRVRAMREELKIKNKNRPQKDKMVNGYK